MKAYMAEALKEALLDDGLNEVAEVTSFEEVTESSGYCSTCYHEYIMLYITYKDIFGKTKRYSYYGSLAELMSY